MIRRWVIGSRQMSARAFHSTSVLCNAAMTAVPHLWQCGPWPNRHSMLVREAAGDVYPFVPQAHLLTAQGAPIISLDGVESDVALLGFVNQYFMTDEDAKDFNVTVKKDSRRHSAVLQFGARLDGLVSADVCSQPKKFNRFNCRVFLPISVRTRCVYSPLVCRALRSFCVTVAPWWSVWGTKEDYEAAGFDIVDQAIGVETIDCFGNMQYLIPCSSSPQCADILTSVHRRPVTIARTPEHTEMINAARAEGSLRRASG